MRRSASMPISSMKSETISGRRCENCRGGLCGCDLGQSNELEDVDHLNGVSAANC